MSGDMHVTIDQAQAVVILWESNRDTLDIANAVGISEAATLRIIHAVREAAIVSAELWGQVEDISGGVLA